MITNGGTGTDNGKGPLCIRCEVRCTREEGQASVGRYPTTDQGTSSIERKRRNWSKLKYEIASECHEKATLVDGSKVGKRSFNMSTKKLMNQVSMIRSEG